MLAMANEKCTSKIWKQGRENAHMTQQRLADRLRVNRSMVAQIETGRREPSVKLMRKFLSIIGVCPLCGNSGCKSVAKNGAHKKCQ